MNDDLFIDEVWNNNPKKKRNSGRLGKSGERALGQLFTARFPNHDPFVRAIGSGNRWSQVQLGESVQQMFASDLITPASFRFVIECKYSYREIELTSLFGGGNKLLDGFLEQVSRDADRVGKKPMLCWRKPRHPWTAWLRSCDSPERREGTWMDYREWGICGLVELLKQPDPFFFQSTPSE